MLIDELRDLIERHAREDGTTPIDGVMVARHDISAPEHSMSGSVMALIAQGVKRLALGDRVYEYGAGQFLVSSLDMPVSGQFVGASSAEPALGFGLILHPPSIADLLLRSGASMARGARGAAPSAMAVSDAPQQLVEAVVRLLRLLDSPRDLPVLAPLIKQEILWWLIVGEQGAAVRHLGLADSNLSHIARAVSWIREHYARPFRVEDVAEISGMSASAFYRHFQAVTAMSPIQFQKQIRLQEARLKLASGRHDVTGVGYSVGYDSPAQFSREYRRQFGTPPSQDSARLRQLPDAKLSALV
ncbi:AraC family transcriptional regulator [Devosia riboflavina]|uniref:AraC family transcriptional regulator n=1 Tax=Devosia riboflavina TaxID=46914 RepID=A0A087M2G7_9HYPH|nr:AraC family transcriptional regulator [Devosia riboflavina]KFL31070.1 AraC family transcriptional regulator [Devosia riboflavina]